MKFFCPLNPRNLLLLSVGLIFSLTLCTAAQTRNRATAKDKTKTQVTAKGKTTQTAKVDPKQKAKSDPKAKPSKAELAKQAEQKKRDDARKQAEARREAEARRAEEARRQAQLAEIRRREQIRREAIARKQAFERGLRIETVANIANDDTSGEDLEVRRAAINALGGHAGSVVVMEPQTGKVLSIVNQQWAIRKGFKPCSTIKLVTAVAGYNEKVIDRSGEITTRNFPIGLDDALAHSNNSYFQAVGSNLGSEKMITYARQLGLGEPTGVNAEGEYAGKLPYGNNNARIYSHGDDFEVTPLQLAVAVSTISNGGKLVVPQIQQSRVAKTAFKGYMRRESTVPTTALQRVLPGMLGAVNYGTAKRAYDDSLNIAGKTGSCIGQGSWLGLFASVAPVVNPKLAIVVVTRGSGERGKYASAIAGNIYKSLSHRFIGTGNMTAKIPLELRPQQKVNAKSSAVLDNDEGEDSDEGDTPKVVVSQQPNRTNPKKGDSDVIIVGQKNNESQKPTIITKPLFDPVVIEVNKQHKRPRIIP